MRAPLCPDHGRLVLDLALGRLEDGTAATAEHVRTTCPVCAAWWRAELEGETAAELDGVLQSAFAAFQPPTRRRALRWLPVAAAAALAIGAGLLWQQHGERPHLTRQLAPSVVTAESFEADRDGNGVVDVDDAGFEVHDGQSGETIFSAGLEDGQLTGWTPHT